MLLNTCVHCQIITTIKLINIFITHIVPFFSGGKNAYDLLS